MRSDCERRWYCASNEGSPCDCAGQLPKFLADWFDAGLDISELPAWMGPRQFNRGVETVQLAGSVL